MTNSADPDQLASSEANWSGSTLFAKTACRVQQEKGELNFTLTDSFISLSWTRMTTLTGVSYHILVCRFDINFNKVLLFSWFFTVMHKIFWSWMYETLCGKSNSLLFIPHHTIVLDVSVSVHPSVVLFLFPDDNMSKRQWIFTKLGMCIDIVAIWFKIANRQILSIFYGVICPRHDNGGVF